MDFKENIDGLLADFKEGRFIYGEGCLGEVGDAVAAYGLRAMLVRSQFPGIEPFVEQLKASLKLAGVELINESIDIIRPNAPEEDMYLLAELLREKQPEVVISMGGGSTIDAVKSAIVLNVLGGDIEDYFGVGKVSEALEKSGKSLTPHVAIQTAASSAAHLTKYSNITNLETKQKKLIVDEAVVPQVPVFDYALTYNTPPELTLDGALDGMSHCLEVYFGATGKPIFEKAQEIATIAITLVVKYLPLVMEDPQNKEARNALCAATDLGGYAIMIGGTSGAHLTSFSLVDLLSHGRACALMNPYYAVFYAPAIQDQLRILGKIYAAGGFSEEDFDKLAGRELGLAFAKAMINFARRVGFPTMLSEIEGFGNKHTERALGAAKNPQLKSKLENMPVPLTSELVDVYMGSILKAAET
ncbi:MAG: iron-containing alcohol dehydrogenase, partial [Bacteroides sp.]|nr:iron-containing alcohol dehydrogenase [Bacteroides sp.]